MNSIVRPIFNEKVDKKWSLWTREQCTNALFTADRVNSCGWGEKKKKKMQKRKRRRAKRPIQTAP